MNENCTRIFFSRGENCCNAAAVSEKIARWYELLCEYSFVFQRELYILRKLILDQGHTAFRSGKEWVTNIVSQQLVSSAFALLFTEISVTHTTEIFVKSSAKAEESS